MSHDDAETHLRLALRAARTWATHLRNALSLGKHTAAQRQLLEMDQHRLHGEIDTLARRRAQSVANRKSRETKNPPQKVKGWRSTMTPAELAAHKGLPHV